MPKLLIVDDDREWVAVLSATLEHAGYDLAIARNGQEALQIFASYQPDLVLLDIKMPGMDGHDVCRRLRDRSDVPILFVSIYGEQAQHVLGGLLEGGDDIMTKTRGASEIVARIEAKLRRTHCVMPSRPPRLYDDGVLFIDFEADVRVVKRGKAIKLTPTQCKLLQALLERQGEIVPHAELLRAVWGEAYGPETAYLAVYVYYLRRDIEDDPSDPQYIVTKHRYGYGFVPVAQTQGDPLAGDDSA